ncbi:MAG: hypothetical protein H7335_09935 [Massilia sp.]|nr:hypothetical protein [Massilia sp.]
MMRRKNKCKKSRREEKEEGKSEEKPGLRENNYEENPEQNDKQNGEEKALSVRRISGTIRSPVTTGSHIYDAVALQHCHHPGGTGS